MAHLEPEGTDIPIERGRLTLFNQVFNVDDSADLFARLNNEIDWKQETLFLFGRHIPAPHLMAWYGDAAYTYSKIRHEPRPWPALLRHLKEKVEAHSGLSFNTVLVNLYRHGRDSMSWHADDEAELGENPAIASLSFGATRRFRLRKISDHKQTLSLDLKDASLLIMGGPLQHHWHHCVPKTERPVGPRINLTFRQVAG